MCVCVCIGAAEGATSDDDFQQAWTHVAEDSLVTAWNAAKAVDGQQGINQLALQVCEELGNTAVQVRSRLMAGCMAELDTLRLIPVSGFINVKLPFSHAYFSTQSAPPNPLHVQQWSHLACLSQLVVCCHLHRASQTRRSLSCSRCSTGQSGGKRSPRRRARPSLQPQQKPRQHWQAQTAPQRPQLSSSSSSRQRQPALHRGSRLLRPASWLLLLQQLAVLVVMGARLLPSPCRAAAAWTVTQAQMRVGLSQMLAGSLVQGALQTQGAQQAQPRWSGARGQVG